MIGNIVNHWPENQAAVVRVTVREWWFFANSSVIIASATVKLDHDLVCLTP